jgi:DNA mismatch repair protein MutS
VLYAYLSHNLSLPVTPASFSPPQHLNRSRFMHIDAHAARALELTRAQDGSSAGTSGSDHSSVFKQLNKTITAGGSRCLQAWLLRPLVDTRAISLRQDAVECFVTRPELRRRVREALEGAGDIRRSVQKMLLNRAAPSDAAALARSLHCVLRLQNTLAAASHAPHGAYHNCVLNVLLSEQ